MAVRTFATISRGSPKLRGTGFLTGQPALHELSVDTTAARNLVH